MFRRPVLLVPFAFATSISFGQPSEVSTLRVHDRFGRDITERGITLVDWEGPIANPAIKLEVRLPAAPADRSEIYFHGNNSRIHFDRSDTDDRYGVGKRVRLDGRTKSIPFLITIFPDRDSHNEEHVLIIQLFGPDRLEKQRLEVPVRVIDQDTGVLTPTYPIHLDYSEDRTGFFTNLQVQSVMRQAADDWEFYISSHVDEVPAGTERIQIWNPDGFKSTREVTIGRSFTGFLMYVTGINHDVMRAGGAPSRIGGMHTSFGRPLTIRRSGSVEFDTSGNWNRLGWFLTQGDDDWWYSGNLRQEQSDLYSIALHEMGHALCFHERYPVIGEAHKQGFIAGIFLQRYLGRSPGLDTSDHMAGVVDPVSRYGAFGMEYLGDMKTRRWLLTKTHLLVLEAAGYRIRRDTTPFAELRPEEREVKLSLKAGHPYTAPLPTIGGVQTYRFSLVRGSLPRGLELDSFSGDIKGTPTELGQRELVVRVEDNDPTTDPIEITVQVEVRD